MDFKFFIKFHLISIQYVANLKLKMLGLIKLLIGEVPLAS